MATSDPVYGYNTPVAPPSDLNEIRRRTNTTPEDYDEDTLEGYLFKYPLVDSYGRSPDDLNWVQDFDLSAVASKIWAEKAAGHVECFDFSADGASYSRSQVYEHCMKMSGYWASRRAPRSLRVVVDVHYERDFQADPLSVLEDGGGETVYLTNSSVINLPEPEDN